MPANYSTNIVYLSKAQYQELLTNQTITVNGTTVTYNENDIYVTPQAEPITDVKINGTSIGSSGVANIPIGNNKLGAVKIGAPAYGLQIQNDGEVRVIRSSDNDLKAGVSGTVSLAPNAQHKSTFYGLAKAAGHDEKNSAEPLGTYTDGAKQAIQNMLGITDLISTEETTTATAAHALNSTFMMNGKLHRATAAIAIGDAVEVGTNCEVVKADEVFVKNTDYARENTPGIVGILSQYGITINNSQPGHYLYLNPASLQEIKAGKASYKAIVPDRQNYSVFYGLSKVAGVDLANETVTLGTYPETSKTAIRSLIGAGTPLDVQINGTSIVDNGIASIPLASTNDAGVVKVSANNGTQIINGVITTYNASDAEIKAGNSGYKILSATNQHKSVFYGLAKAAGDTTQSVSTNAVGTYTDDAKAAIQTMLGVPGDVQVNGTSVVSNGVANIPIASSNTFGVVKTNTNYGTEIYNGQIMLQLAATSTVKAGTNYYQPIVPYNQHSAAFYGLAKAAGDTTQSASSNAVGTYTDEAKAAIQTMLGIDLQSIASEVEIPLVETVEGTTPSIAGQPNVRYVCDEVSTLSITPPASGSMDVIFESGSTAAVLTVPNTVKWPAWFDATALEVDTTYEILITDGIYGSVMTWAT